MAGATASASAVVACSTPCSLGTACTRRRRSHRCILLPCSRKHSRARSIRWRNSFRSSKRRRQFRNLCGIEHSAREGICMRVSCVHVCACAYTRVKKRRMAKKKRGRGREEQGERWEHLGRVKERVEELQGHSRVRQRDLGQTHNPEHTPRRCNRARTGSPHKNVRTGFRYSPSHGGVTDSVRAELERLR